MSHRMQNRKVQKNIQYDKSNTDIKYLRHGYWVVRQILIGSKSSAVLSSRCRTGPLLPDSELYTQVRIPRLLQARITEVTILLTRNLHPGC